ncbi:MAG: type II toxin-antitoxin system RelE/ParE family toxin [Elusimicrobia bacterium]|nr:type II toxin-antitoxin system RelE/ParE family toxin [Elusimicrobiota bacterium]
MRVVLTPQALQDLDAIREPLYSRVVSRLAALGDFPEIGAAIPGPFAGLRSTVVDFFRIVYRITDVRVEVAYIRDCRRRPPA